MTRSLALLLLATGIYIGLLIFGITALFAYDYRAALAGIIGSFGWLGVAGYALQEILK